MFPGSYQIFIDPRDIHFPHSSNSKESACNAGDMGSILGSGRATGEGHGNPIQYSCRENPLDRGAWWVHSHGVTKNWKTERLTHMGIFSFSIDFKHGDQCLSFSKNITALL